MSLEDHRCELLGLEVGGLMEPDVVMYIAYIPPFVHVTF